MHDCACCPSNLVRVISSISGYAYSHHDHTINVNMYLQSKGVVPLRNSSVTLTQTTEYPWDGDIRIAVDPRESGRFRIRLRIPGWARNTPTPGNLYRYLERKNEPVELTINDSPVELAVEGGYATLDRTWRSGDTIRLVLPMQVRRVIAHPNVTADVGLVAIERGPLVYCVEFKDNSFDVGRLKLPDSAELTSTLEKDLFNGVVTLSSDGDPGLKLIPYYSI